MLLMKWTLASRRMAEKKLHNETNDILHSRMDGPESERSNMFVSVYFLQDCLSLIGTLI